jgi:glutamine synthetase
VEKLNQAVRRNLKSSGIPVENSKGEWGLGQHELNIRYAEALDMADRHSIYKQCFKEIADELEMSVTFMAKYDDEQAGSSCHVHLSLWENDRNAFAGEEELGPVRCSETFRWFLGGWIAHVPDVMVFYAPTTNSYRRYKAGSWAPTQLAWSHDNRTAGFRVVGAGSSLRIECRLPGADCNPYLVYAAALASGLDGIANRTEPPLTSRATSTRRKSSPQFPQTSPRRRTSSRRAPSRERPLAMPWSITTRASSAPRMPPATPRSATGTASATSSASENRPLT